MIGEGASVYAKLKVLFQACGWRCATPFVLNRTNHPPCDCHHHSGCGHDGFWELRTPTLLLDEPSPQPIALHLRQPRGSEGQAPAGRRNPGTYVCTLGTDRLR
mmetsp:Transcript_3709/g.6748  ORF Transcript_3709/g.6748 Transcript_3709/m.6748 type:complete len:103 (+) Transcript_3709:18-326(+)